MRTNPPGEDIEEGEGKKPMVVGEPGGLEGDRDERESADGPVNVKKKGKTNSLLDLYPGEQRQPDSQDAGRLPECFAMNKGTFRGHGCLSSFL